MKKPICFSEIRPFVRFVRQLYFSSGSRGGAVVPCDSRLFFCLSGGGTILTEGRELRMKRGDVLLLPQGCPYILHGSAEEVAYLAVNFDYTQEAAHLKKPILPIPLEDFSGDGVLSDISFSDETALNSPLYLGEMYRLEEPLAHLLSVFSRKIIYYECELAALFTEILLECLRSHRLNPLSRNRAAFQRVLDYLHEHYREHLTNSSVAAVLGYHPNYVSELVKRATGLSLHRYLLSVRIKHAIDLLEEGERSVGEIAAYCGFCDIYHFSRAFKMVTGVAPTHYRRGSGGAVPPIPLP